MTIRKLAVSAAALMTLCAVPAFSQFTHAAPEDFNDHEGFTSLFDGKSLAGWDGDSSMWSVKDGAIYINPTCEKPTGTVYIVWQGGELADFDLKMEMKGTGAINGGIQYRSWLSSDPNAPKPPARGGGAGGGRGGSGRGPGGGRGGSGAAAFAGGRGPATACPSGQPRGTQPDRTTQAKWDMGGYQYDFDNPGQYPGQLYEQLTGRGIITWKGEVVETREGKPKQLLGSLGDKATVDSWFKKDDWNTLEIIAVGNVLTHLINGHLVSETIDNERSRSRASGKIGIEVENFGELLTRNIWLKKY